MLPGYEMAVPQRTFPDSILLRTLFSKAAARGDVDFNHESRLSDLRQRVSQEVRFIDRLFPEYTPHDEENHLRRLFHVADTVLGSDRIDAMNSSELFVLACGLYAHDWGMAVSDTEKTAIITGRTPPSVDPRDLWMLPNESTAFDQFLRRQMILRAEPTDAVPDEVWREHVRQTHAYRSAARVRRFFESIDAGVGEAVARACEGHWLTFEELRDYRSFPPDFAVLRESVNLRAVAVYLRLVDLLDLAHDRTPYVIWKFVAPKDGYSRTEWLKHRALQPVTCPSYLMGRMILVDGGTDDHEVFAALEDLRNYVEEQRKGCMEVLAQLNDPRHALDLYHLEWRVAARGFQPVSIRFEFDRDSVLDILSDEIYQGDPYVFLRELLQNSVDAIRMRREVLRREGVGEGAVGLIVVHVQHGQAGDVTITWRDDGSGMDEYIVQKYLAVAGRSYYQSEDFQREGLRMDPISRFGIGILSCFMVAERVEIITRREPYLGSAAATLRIAIPAANRQFRVERRSPAEAEVGTSVRVSVEGQRLPRESDERPKQLDVTAYLKAIGGFVEFPIFVSEGDRKTLLIHPRQQPSEALLKRLGQPEIYRMPTSYPWDEIFLPQDLKAAAEIFVEERLDIANDLHVEGYEGYLAYLRLKPEVIG
jgi:Histidine kinase-, DNA gyrase B-, and HSP90-like ATPase